jgi:hypothetical protein
MAGRPKDGAMLRFSEEKNSFTVQVACADLPNQTFETTGLITFVPDASGNPNTAQAEVSLYLYTKQGDPESRQLVGTVVGQVNLPDFKAVPVQP